MLHLLHLLPSPTSRFAGLLSVAENENKPVLDNVGLFSKNRTDRISLHIRYFVRSACRQVVAPHLPSVLTTVEMLFQGLSVDDYE